MIYHYTTIETLALILKTKKIRFNRLDNVDDLEEISYFNQTTLKTFSKYCFISCWTNTQDESIPQWSMYADKMFGVRIGFPEDIFNLDSISIYGKDYIILPSYRNKDIFFKTVEYLDTPEKEYESLIHYEQNKQETKLNIKPDGFKRMAKFKNKAWDFQDEVRFFLTIFPFTQNIDSHLSKEKQEVYQVQFLATCIQKGIPAPINYFDVEIKENVLDNIEVTIGPFVSDGNKTIIELLLKEYTKNGNLNLKESTFKDKIQKPKR